MIEVYESGHCERETGLLLVSDLKMLGVARKKRCSCKKMAKKNLISSRKSVL